jgi:hypothetical protein
MSRKGQKNVERVNALLEFIFWFPKSNAVHYLYVILKLHYVVENQPFGLTHKMTTGYCFCRFLA